MRLRVGFFCLWCFGVLLPQFPAGDAFAQEPVGSAVSLAAELGAEELSNAALADVRGRGASADPIPAPSTLGVILWDEAQRRAVTRGGFSRATGSTNMQGSGVTLQRGGK